MRILGTAGRVSGATGWGAVVASQSVLVGLTAAVAIALLFALCSLGTVLRLWREVMQVRHASKAFGNGGLHGLDQVLREQELQLRQAEDRVTELERRLGQAELRLAGAIQHVSVVRFNPFRDAGGEQSFVIALLDDGGTGILVTGIHSRAETRIYAKPVVAGNSQYPLSEEEVSAMRSAVATPLGVSGR